MGRYILKRLLWMIPIILGVTILVFSMMTVCPGDPAEIILGSTATQADLAAKREQLGLTQPFLVRLGKYMSDVFLRFDLGKSWITGVSISASIPERMGRTMTLAVVTLIIAFGLGIERIALLKYHIDDMRLLYENDIRFLNQF